MRPIVEPLASGAHQIIKTGKVMRPIVELPASGAHQIIKIGKMMRPIAEPLIRERIK
jgi:hypothetical protein